MKSSDYRKLNNPLAECEIIIGIDPGKNTGFAVYWVNKNKWMISKETFWSAMDWITGAVYEDQSHLVGIVIEISNSKRPIYNRVDGNSDAGRVRETMAVRIGGNRREGELMAERLESLGFPVVRKTPSQTKWNAAECKRITGITLKTNEHTRDAIRLAYEYI